MIWDTFLFAGELDILECRLRTLDRAVGRFVMAEAAWDHQGRPRLLSRPHQMARFARWARQITYVPVTTMPDIAHVHPYKQGWVRENWQRGALLGVLTAAPDDVILHGDVDEIPNPKALASLPPLTGARVLLQRYHPFAADWQHPDPWHGTAVIPARVLAAHPNLIVHFHVERKSGPPIPDGGWHLSWYGGPDAIRAKAVMVAHSEYRDCTLAGADAAYEQGIVPWDESKCDPVDVDGTWPEWIARRECPVSWFRPR